MRRVKCAAAMLLASIFLSLLSGCISTRNALTDGVNFYYLRTDFQYGTADGVIDSEVREIPSYADDVTYLLQLYFQGPVAGDLHSPFPENTRLTAAQQEGQTLYITLSTSFDSFSGMEQTLACACLTMTCLELADIDTVSITTQDGIQNGENPIVMRADSLTLLDRSTELPTETGGN